MKIIRLLLYPISVLYGVITWFRNVFFDFGVLESKVFDCHIISVGNLSAGGSGKTPHIEYIANLIKSEKNIAILSRGYGRITSGFRLASSNTSAKEIGDEPKLLFNRLNQKVTVAADANRRNGVQKLMETQKTEVVLLDDGFQHRYVKPSLNILLTPYQKLYINDTILPTGYLREYPSGSKRADIIVVTKTPEKFSKLEKRMVAESLNQLPYQEIYFSYYKYGDFVPLNSTDGAVVDKSYYYERNYSALLVTGIANSSNLFYKLKNKFKDVRHIEYKDHHNYTSNDITRIRKEFDIIAGDNKIIVTTEKDAMRLKSEALSKSIEGLPIFYIPIEVQFHDGDSETFNEQILKHVRRNKIDSTIHSENS